MTWKGKSGIVAIEMEIVDIRTEISFLGKSWMEKTGVKVKQGSCVDSIRLADGSRRTIRYQTEKKLINEMNREINMSIWIIELENKDIIVGQDWLMNIRPIINWETKKLEINQNEMKKNTRLVDESVGSIWKISGRRVIIRKTRDGPRNTANPGYHLISIFDIEEASEPCNHQRILGRHVLEGLD